MSDMVKRYEESQKLRPQQARQIPGNPVNFMDQTNQFQEGWTNNQRRGDPSTFTQRAFGYFDEELSQKSVPDGFTPTEQGINLHRWSPKNKYYEPGKFPG